MSVRENIYVVHGIVLDYEEYNERYNIDDNEQIHDDYTGKDSFNDLNIIADYMSGDYVVIGHVLESADLYNGESLPFITINPTEHDKLEVKNNLKEYLGIDIDEEGLSLEVFAFTHYS